MAILSKTSRKRHTKPCLYFQTNDCPLSADECDFAHVIATPEESEALKNPQATLRTKPCRFFLGGKCRDGYWCRFKHPASMFAASRESDASLLEDVPELDSDKSTTEEEDVDVRDLDGWKARPEEHPKYRTRPCRNFILGKCIYGERCSYLHVLPSPNSPSPPIVSDAVQVPPPSPPLATTAILSYFPTTPPPNRAPPSTPVNAQEESQSDASDSSTDSSGLAASAFRTPVRSRFNSAESSDMQTPSTASSGFSEEPPTTPGSSPPLQAMSGGTDDCARHPHLHRGARNNVPPLPAFPLSPLSPLAYAHPRDYMSAKNVLRSPLSLDYMNHMPLSPLSSPPPPLSMSMYSPTSPVPLQIVHVPFAVPMYPEMPLSPGSNPPPNTKSSSNPPKRISVSTQKSQPPQSQTPRTRGRAFSQPDASILPTSPESLLYRSKPCKFFSEAGTCQKGDQCNFSHDRAPTSPSPPCGNRPPTVQKDSPTTNGKAVKEQKTIVTPDKLDEPKVHESPKVEEKDADPKSNNFYPISWRVVGGGVKIGHDKTGQRRHSEDASILYQRRPSFRNPFDYIGERSASTTKVSLSPAAILKDRARSLASAMVSSNPKTKPSLLVSRKGADKALSLSLQAYSLTKATDNSSNDNNSKKVALHDEVAPAVVIVQGDIDDDERDGGESVNGESAASMSVSAALRQDVAARAKSSPSTPIKAHLNIPNMVFAAESP